jgi:hypothetical protein
VAPRAGRHAGFLAGCRGCRCRKSVQRKGDTTAPIFGNLLGANDSLNVITTGDGAATIFIGNGINQVTTGDGNSRIFVGNGDGNTVNHSAATLGSASIQGALGTGDAMAMCSSSRPSAASMRRLPAGSRRSSSQVAGRTAWP